MDKRKDDSHPETPAGQIINSLLDEVFELAVWSVDDEILFLERRIAALRRAYPMAPKED